MVGAEAARLVELAFAGGEGRHIAAVSGGELDAHVSETADADDADAAGRFDIHRTNGLNTVMPPHNSGPASAKLSWSGNGSVQAQCARTWLANPPRWPTIVGCGLRTQVLIARHAQLAVHATGGRPADAHPLADFEPLGRRPERDHPADDLVPKDCRELRKTPFVVEHGNVGVTQPAMLHLDFDVLGLERAEVDLLANQFLLGRRGDPCVDYGHRIAPLSEVVVLVP